MSFEIFVQNCRRIEEEKVFVVGRVHNDAIIGLVSFHFQNRNVFDLRSGRIKKLLLRKFVRLCWWEIAGEGDPLITSHSVIFAVS